MAGLLNASANPDAGQKQVDDPLLQKIEKQIESKVPQQLRAQYDGIVVSGMSIMYDANSRQFIKERMEASPDMVKNVATGVADLVKMVFDNSGQGKSPKSAQAFFEASMLACVTLMCQVLDMAEKIGALEVSNEIIGKCTELTYKETMRRFGVTEEMVRAEIAKGKGGKGAPPAQPTAAPQQPMQGA